MPSKRQVLGELKRDELIAAVEQFGLPVADRRVRSLLIEALASSRKAPIAVILEELKRDRLKELCRALGLDDGGREKALIVERLTGARSRRKASVQKAVGLESSGSAGLTNRQILEVLKRDELINAVDLFELEIADKRVRSQLIEALASPAVPIEEILGTLKRDRLKELCRASGLDDGGREKALIIERLTGVSPRQASTPRGSSGPS